MRVHVPKQRQTQQQASPTLTRSSAKPLAARATVHPILHLQRTIGNQAVLWLRHDNAEALEVGSEISAITSFAHDFSRIPLHSTTPKAAQTKLTIKDPEEKHGPKADQAAAQLMQLPEVKVSSPDSSPIIQRKCAACESGWGVCPKCAGEEGRMRRMLTTPTNMIPANLEKRKQEPAQTQEGGEKEPSEMGTESLKKPDLTVELRLPSCKKVYGAIARLCYDKAFGWWHKEEIKMEENTCMPGAMIDASKTPYQNDPGEESNCFFDEITNPNGPPAKRAPCKTVTTQTTHLGPTKAKVGIYKYKNTQTIKVTVNEGKGPKSGKVITSVDTESASVKPASCDWKT
jgi:hypothetical protein